MVWPTDGSLTVVRNKPTLCANLAFNSAPSAATFLEKPKRLSHSYKKKDSYKKEDKYGRHLMQAEPSGGYGGKDYGKKYGGKNGGGNGGDNGDDVSVGLSLT